MTPVLHDLHYSLRMLRRSPGFVALSVLVLALGIGATTAAFSIVNSVFFKPLAVPDPQSLVYVYSVTERGQRHTSFGQESVAFFNGHYDKAFTGVAGHWGWSMTVGAEDESRRASGEMVTSTYFDVVGVKPMFGRTFGPEHDDPANPSKAVVISHSLWMQRFKQDPQILSKQVRLNDKIFSIIGVMPEGFVGLSDPWQPSEFWVPVVQLDLGREYSSLGTVARLRPDVTLLEAQSIVDVHGAQMQIEKMRETPRRNWRPIRQVVVPATSVSDPSLPDRWLIEPRMLTAISAVVFIILLISATNIAGVLAARGVTRVQEIAVRQALGAGAPALVRQLLTESVLISVAGGVLGLALAQGIVSIYEGFAPAQFLVEVQFDLRVALFTIGIGVASGLLIGIVPALQGRSVNVLTALSGGAGSAGNRRVKRRLRHVILIPQIALSVVLLVVAGVHVRSLAGIQSADVGYRIDNVVTMRIDHWDTFRWQSSRDPKVREERAARDREFYRAVLRRLDSVQSDGGVAIASGLPPQSWTMPGRFTNRSRFDSGDPARARADADWVSPGYFQTMGMTLESGRDFDARDAMTMPHVAIVSSSLARELWPAGNAVGESIAWHFPDDKKQPWWLEVIGVVNETTPALQDIGERPMIYMNLAQVTAPGLLTVVGADSDPAALIQQLKAAVLGADPYAEIHEVRSMSQIVDELLYPRRAAVAILIAGGLTGLLLASIGIYGAISYSVAQRLQEIGIRATLGADRRAILGLVLGEATRVTVIGAAPGLLLGFLALRVSANILGPMPTFDLLTFGVVPIAAIAVILAASYVPARRASRLDPMTVLRGL